METTCTLNLDVIYAVIVVYVIGRLIGDLLFHLTKFLFRRFFK